MGNLRTIALSALIREAASKIGYENVKPKQIETVLEFCKGKDVFVSLPTGYGKTLIFAVLPSLFNPMRKVTTTIRQALFAYAASVKALHRSSSAARDASASVLSHLPISPLISLFIAFLW